jgi:hypothetical protein
MEKEITSDDALQTFIDQRIPKDLQPLYRDRIEAYRSAWDAALRCERERKETACQVNDRRMSGASET